MRVLTVLKVMQLARSETEMLQDASIKQINKLMEEKAAIEKELIRVSFRPKGTLIVIEQNLAFNTNYLESSSLIFEYYGTIVGIVLASRASGCFFGHPNP